MIRYERKRYNVYSKDGKKLASYRSEKQARERLRLEAAKGKK
jgi:hypothetical protein